MPNGKEEARYSNFWVFDIGSKTETRLSEANFVVTELDVSSDGNRVVLIASLCLHPY